MKEGYQLFICVLLASIAVSLVILNIQLLDINRAIDQGKFMPFIYTGEDQ